MITVKNTLKGLLKVRAVRARKANKIKYALISQLKDFCTSYPHFSIDEDTRLNCNNRGEKELVLVMVVKSGEFVIQRAWLKWGGENTHPRFKVDNLDAAVVRVASIIDQYLAYRGFSL